MAVSSPEPAARLLDITRLISRAGHGAPTGIDRVELAYLRRLCGETVPLFLLARSNLGFILLGGDAAGALLRRMSGAEPWGAADLLGRLARTGDPARAAAEADLRRLGLDRCRPGGLAAMLRRHLPAGAAYLNVGHSNLSAETLAALRLVPGMRIAVLLHDTIPLDHPGLSGLGAPERFAAKLGAVLAHADLVICNSRATLACVRRHAAGRGRVPEMAVAHLGVEPLRPAPDELPPGLDLTRPYFVTVGTIEPRKNHALLLDVWAGLAESQGDADLPLLYIAGARGWRNEAVFRRLDSAPFMGRAVVELAGLSDGALAALLVGSRALLFPSLAEGYGLPPLEAAALGVPVVVADLPVYREHLGDFAVYLDGTDPYSWRNKISDLARGSTEANRPERAVVPTWNSHFDIVLSLT